MRHWFNLGVLILLIAVTATASKDPRAEKRAKLDRATVESVGVPSLAKASISLWDTLNLVAFGNSLDDVFATPEGFIWVGGYDLSTDEDFILRSTDNGATWTRRSLTFTNSLGYSMTVRDANIALAATWIGDIYRTTDGGANWTNVFTYGGGNGYFNGIKFTGGDSVMAMGDADASGLCVVKSTDAGATWTRFTNLPAAELNTSTISSSSYHQCMDGIGPVVWITTYYGNGTAPRILRTTDFGATWTSADVLLTGGLSNAYSIRSINLASATEGWLVPRQTASGVRSYVHRSTDGGATWSDSIQVETGCVVKSVKPIRGTNFLLAVGYKGDDPKAWWSTNGTTWTDISPGSPGDGTDMTNAHFLGQTLGYVVGYQKALKFTPPTTDVGNEPTTVPTAFTVEQNYPNPFNPSTTIRFALPMESQVSLKVYDLLGQLVATIQEGMMNAGTHTLTFDASNLPSGLYLYTVQAGGFTSSRKMLLLK